MALFRCHYLFQITLYEACNCKRTWLALAGDVAPFILTLTPRPVPCNYRLVRTRAIHFFTRAIIDRYL